MRPTDPDRKRGRTYRFEPWQIEVAIAVLEKEEQQKEKSK